MNFRKLIKNKNDHRIAVWGIVIIILLTLLSLLNFNNIVNDKINDMGISYISDLTNEIQLNLKNEIDNSLNFVEGISASLEDYEDIFSVESLTYLNRVCKFSNFSNLWVADLNGKASKLGGPEIDLSDRDYFKEGLSGISGISQVVTSKYNRKEEIVIYSPIYNKKNLVGILLGTYNLEEYTTISKTPIVKGEGFVEIFRKSGEFVSKSAHKNSYFKEWNNVWDYFEVSKLKGGQSFDRVYEDIQKGNSGSLEYQIDKNERIAYYKEMGINDWIIMVVIPKDIVMEYSKPIYTSVAFLIGQIVVSFIALIIIVLLYDKRIRKMLLKINEELKISKERFLIAIHQTGGLVVEYDVIKKTLKYFGDDELEYSLVGLDEFSIGGVLYLGVVDKEYSEVIVSLFKKIDNGEKTAVGIIKTWTKDGNSNWSKITFTTIFNDNGFPIKAIGTIEDITTNKNKEILLKYKAERDQLTGVYNRGTTERLIDYFIKNSPDEGIQAFMSLDLDKFKEVNDNHGHMIGDELLIEMTNELKKVIRKTDILGRMGGDEFVIFLKDIDSIEQVDLKAKEICEVLKSLSIIQKEGLKVSGSLGIAISPIHGTSFLELYKKSDIALYAAKNAGRDQYKIYDDVKNKKNFEK